MQEKEFQKFFGQLIFDRNNTRASIENFLFENSLDDFIAIVLRLLTGNFYTLLYLLLPDK